MEETKIWRDFCSAIVKIANMVKEEFDKKEHKNGRAIDLENLFEGE